MALLELRNLHVSYSTPGAEVGAVVGVDLDVDTGEVVGVVGESGSGKTSLILAALRLVPLPGRIVKGSISLGGIDVRGLSPARMRTLRGKDIAYVPQAAMNSMNPVMTVGAQITESLDLHTHLDGRQTWARVAEVLEMVELESKIARRYPHQLSGGMRQRAIIAMALAPNPQLVLADEPTSGLDVLVRVQLLRLLRRLVDELGLALLMVSHDLPLVARWCDRAVVMYAGRIVEEGPAPELLTSPMHPYAHALARSLPRLHGEDEPERIPGEVPDLSRVPVGCPFNPRCIHAFDLCRERAPQLISVEGHNVSCHLHAG